MKSMTGFARKTFYIKNYGHIRIEIKSVNSKGLNINFKLPDELFDIEHRIRKIIAKTFRRGSIVFIIRIDYSNDFIIKSMKRKIKRMESIIDDLSNNSMILQNIMPQILNSINEDYNINKTIKDEIIKQSQMIIKDIDNIRIKEGKSVKREFKDFTKSINKNLIFIERIKDQVIKNKKEKLSQMIKENEALIIENILIYADKIDISEEISRIKEHLNSIKNETKGTTINFILQELLRETNTIGSKTDDIRVIKKVIAIKEIIEKMKEQVMNIE